VFSRARLKTGGQGVDIYHVSSGRSRTPSREKGASERTAGHNPHSPQSTIHPPRQGSNKQDRPRVAHHSWLSLSSRSKASSSAPDIPGRASRLSLSPPALDRAGLIQIKGHPQAQSTRHKARTPSTGSLSTRRRQERKQKATPERGKKKKQLAAAAASCSFVPTPLISARAPWEPEPPIIGNHTYNSHGRPSPGDRRSTPSPTHFCVTQPNVKP